jgi:hypothetical protein
MAAHEFHQILMEAEFFHKQLRLHPARLKPYAMQQG